MEMVYDRLTALLTEKLSWYQSLESLLESETDVIRQMDLDGLWQLAGRKNEILTAIQALVATLQEQFSVQEIEFADIVDAVAKTTDQKTRLKTLKTDLNISRENIARHAAENSRYIREYSGVIDGVFATVMKSGQSRQYGAPGKSFPDRPASRLFYAEV